MIVGIGTDILELARIHKIIARAGWRKFAARILTVNERKLITEEKRQSGRLVEFIAGRFAAKEAVVKALGCGFGAFVGFHDLDILPDDRGRPVCYLSSDARLRLGLSDGVRIHLSISHSRTMALAYAVVEERKSDGRIAD